MEQIRKLPIRVQDFASLINEGYRYIDKTDYIYKAVKQGKSYF